MRLQLFLCFFAFPIMVIGQNCGADSIQVNCLFSLNDGTEANEHYPPESFVCSWLLTPETEETQLTFNYINTYTDRDFITIYNGPSTTDSLLCSISGLHDFKSLQASSDSILIVFESVENVFGKGFELDGRCIDSIFQNVYWNINTNIRVENKTKIIVDGWIQNSGTNSIDTLIVNYNINENAVASPGSDSVFYTDTIYELAGGEKRRYLDSLDLKHFFEPGGYKYFGLTLAPDSQFKDSIPEDNFFPNSSSFNSRIPIQFPYCEMDNHFTECEGVLEDGSMDQDYQQNTSCSWKIEAPEGKVVAVELEEYDIEMYSFLWWVDHFEFSWDKMLALNNLNQVVSTNPFLYVEFMGEFSGKGFSGHYRCVDSLWNNLRLSTIVSPTYSEQENTISGLYKFSNNGKTDVSGGTVGVYLSEDEELDSTDVLLQKLEGVFLEQGEFIEWDLNVNLDTILVNQSGSYFVLGMADPEGTIEEAFELDNLILDPQFTIPITGVISEYESEELLVFPNPAKEILNLEMEKIIADVKMINSNGECVFEKRMYSTKGEIEVSFYSPGVYCIYAFTDQGFPIQRKVVVLP